jgi:hypothetical protein
MNTEPRLISVVGEKPLPKYYVFYDEWSGEIHSVGNKFKDIGQSVLYTEDSTAAEILLGHLNPRKYIVNDTASGTFIMAKKDALRIKAEEDQLSKIVTVPLSVDREINVIAYVDSMMLEINIHNDVVLRMAGNNINKKFAKAHNQNNTILYFYIVQKNNPNILYKTIKIDPIDLINNGYVLYDLYDLSTKVALGNIDVLTRRVFKSYGLKTKNRYVSLDFNKRKTSKRNTIHITDNNPEAAFIVSQSTKGWIFKSNFTNPEEIRIYSDLDLYIIGKSPNELRGRIKIPKTELGYGKEYLVNTTVDLSTSKFLVGESGKNITFNYEEIK